MLNRTKSVQDPDADLRDAFKVSQLKLPCLSNMLFDFD